MITFNIYLFFVIYYYSYFRRQQRCIILVMHHTFRQIDRQIGEQYFGAKFTFLLAPNSSFWGDVKFFSFFGAKFFFFGGRLIFFFGAKFFLLRGVKFMFQGRQIHLFWASNSSFLGRQIHLFFWRQIYLFLFDAISTLFNTLHTSHSLTL